LERIRPSHLRPDYADRRLHSGWRQRGRHTQLISWTTLGRPQPIDAVTSQQIQTAIPLAWGPVFPLEGPADLRAK